MLRPSQRSGFTLIEILIVVVILGILAAIVIPQFTHASQQSKSTATLVDLGRIRRSIDAYRAKNREVLPPVIEGVATWGPVVARGGDYMMQPPTNQWVGGPNAKTIHFGTAPDTVFHQNYGWIYNPANGQLWAACFDADDNPLTPP